MFWLTNKKIVFSYALLSGGLNCLIAHFIDISMFNFKYLAMHKMLMHGGAISKLWFCVYTGDNPQATVVPTKSDNDIIFVYNNFVSKTLSDTIHLS